MHKKIIALIDNEFETAMARHGAFRSQHEGSAILKEEIEELGEALALINQSYEELWYAVRCDNTDSEAIVRLYTSAVNAGLEAVHVGAMARKFATAFSDIATQGIGSKR